MMARLWYLAACSFVNPARMRSLVNRQRGHQSPDYRTPDEVYFGARADEFAAVA